MLILGIETSCDETAAAVVEDGRNVLSNVVASQIEIHQKYRGVVPEIACRAHSEAMLPVVEEAVEKSGRAMSDMDAVAVTSDPGLIGCLLIGLSSARTAGLLLEIPVVEVNHIEAHIYSAAMTEPFEYPVIGLVVSGGHTDIFLSTSETSCESLGHTIDDAAGEAFDKVAAIMDLPYPGGPSIEKASLEGNEEAIDFPRSYLDPDSLNFSFSGIKTAVLYHCRGPKGRDPIGPDVNVADVSASFQKAVVDVIVDKTMAAAEKHRVKTVVVGGGVACNSVLRSEFARKAQVPGIEARFPPREYCTDNAAMIAGLGYYLLKMG